MSVATAIAGLRPSAPEPLPFAPALHIRAFTLERRHGDVLVYSTSGVEADTVTRQYLNHGHEAMFLSDAVGAPLFVHEADRTAVPRRVRGTFSRRHTLDDDFEVIPIPGHTPGATAYLWDNGAQRLLFTGDSVYLRDGEWVGAVLGSSDRAAYLQSLELIRELEFDVLVPWAASAGQPEYAITDRADTRRRIDAIVDRVQRGESG
jgi:glyoxylase-like metal-dependent hydrolase (beta-lactamase superfamily II)